jgi:AcrR family transcriptional regulator
MTRQEVQTPEVPLDTSAQRRIIDAAREHFFAHGFRSVTMADLAEELGMSKKTIYAHFARKTDLLQVLLLEKFRCVERDLDRIISKFSGDFPTRLHRLLACLQEHAEEIRPPFVRDLQREAPDLFRLVEARRRESIQRNFSKLLGEGRREGLIRKDIPVHLMIEILLGAVEAIVNPPRLAELGLSVKSAMTAIISVIVGGTLTPEGRAKL